MSATTMLAKLKTRLKCKNDYELSKTCGVPHTLIVNLRSGKQAGMNVNMMCRIAKNTKTPASLLIEWWEQTEPGARRRAAAIAATEGT